MRVMPLTQNGPSHCSRSQATSAQVGGGVNIHCPYAPKNVGGSSPPTGMFGTVRSGILPARSIRRPQRGRVTPSGMYLISVLRSIFSGMAGLPQSRPWENDQSRVTMSPLAPAFLARSARAARVSRSPTQYIWKKVFSLASRTSSTDRLANELSPIAVPAFFAARATATSPSGSTACTPVGEMITGIEMSWPITVVDRSFSNGRSHTCGRNSSSRNAAMLSSRVAPASLPATRAP